MRLRGKAKRDSPLLAILGLLGLGLGMLGIALSGPSGLGVPHVLLIAITQIAIFAVGFGLRVRARTGPESAQAGWTITAVIAGVYLIPPLWFLGSSLEVRRPALLASMGCASLLIGIDLGAVEMRDRLRARRG